MKFFILSLFQLHSYFPKSIIEFTVNLKSIRLYAAEKHELKISVKVGGKKIGIKISKSLKKVLPGVEPRSLDSKSRVLTTTP
jgi:hypothetical protein